MANRGQRPEELDNQKKLEEAVHQGFFEFLPDGAVIVDHQGKIVQVNAQLERIFGYSRDEIMGKSVEILVPGRFAAQHAEQ